MTSKIEQARNLLIQSALDDILSVDNVRDFYLHTYYVIAKLGLHQEAKKEYLFEGNEWTNPYCREYLIERLRKFLMDHIK